MRKLLFVLLFASAAYAAKPETVIVTYHPKAGKEADLLRSVQVWAEEAANSEKLDFAEITEVTR